MDNHDVSPSQPLRQAHERAIGVTVPLPISKRLDLLVERAEESGIRIYRKDLVAALILAAPETPEALRDLFLNLNPPRNGLGLSGATV